MEKISPIHLGAEVLYAYISKEPGLAEKALEEITSNAGQISIDF